MQFKPTQHIHHQENLNSKKQIMERELTVTAVGKSGKLYFNQVMEVTSLLTSHIDAMHTLDRKSHPQKVIYSMIPLLWNSGKLMERRSEAAQGWVGGECDCKGTAQEFACLMESQSWWWAHHSI